LGGSLSLWDCVVELGIKNSFTLTQPDGQKFDYTAQTTELAKDWVRQIGDTITKLKQTPLYLYQQVCFLFLITRKNVFFFIF